MTPPRTPGQICQEVFGRELAKATSYQGLRDAWEAAAQAVLADANHGRDGFYQIIVSAMSLLEDINCVPEHANLVGGIKTLRDALADANQRIAELEAALAVVRDTSVALIDVNNQKLNSVLTVEAPRRLRDLSCAVLANRNETQP
jgi:hypothetical protein